MELSSGYVQTSEEKKEQAKQEYMKYRDEKWDFFEQHIIKNSPDLIDKMQFIRFGFLKGLDTATKGGKFVNK